MSNISNYDFLNCYQGNPLILTEGAIGLRISNEFGIIPDKQIKNASLIYDSAGRKTLETVYRQYLQVAQDFSLPILLMTNTRRVNKESVLCSPYKSKDIMHDYAEFLREIAGKYKCETYIGGIMGCKGDAYTGEGKLSVKDSFDFHSWQVDAFTRSDIDFIYAGIMPAVDEIIGMAKAIENSDYPYIISFMIKESGTIIDGHSIHNAIEIIDDSTQQRPLCYMTNCVHPNILKKALSTKENNSRLVRERFNGIQANAAFLPAEELECAIETKSSSANELIDALMLLHNDFPMKIYGGCCGTDDTHIREIAKRFRI